MAKTHPHKVLKRAEAAGIKIAIVADEWTDRIFPLVPSVSPDRCELVAEARRIADMLDTRVDPPPDGVVYGIDTKTLETALALATAYIERVMKGDGTITIATTVGTKGNGNAKSHKDAAQDNQSDVVHGDDTPNAEPDVDARGAGNRKAGGTKKRGVQDRPGGA